MASVFGLALLAAHALSGGVKSFSVLPSETDRRIQAFNSVHTIYIDKDVAPRRELLVFLPGTNGKTTNAKAFLSTAAEQGYQVISLMYPDDVPAAIVRDDPDSKAFLNFRLEVIEGRDLSKAVAVAREDSIENRLVKVLEYLDKNRPGEHWGEYLAKGEPNWRQIAVSGLSQGAGHAALLAARHRVARAVLFGGPKDYSRASHGPANWYKPSQTPVDMIFTFNHKQDRQGCTYEQQLEICRFMGLEKLGKAVEVESAKAPYEGSHILVTNYPGTALTSVRAHTSVVADPSSPLAADGTRLFKPVWVYMLTSGRK